ncbi:hypothetical protein GCM10011339_14130 [Echinicola rosea]|uniref:Uncharacterized protein n=1 Tax=Echinicola rosea TaxID=1807691 RepID=A0ABQ1UWH0_9BACT|nr:hypothetical protein GCM10011339_14130 [Echinicola rosea]
MAKFILASCINYIATMLQILFAAIKFAYLNFNESFPNCIGTKENDYAEQKNKRHYPDWLFGSW